VSEALLDIVARLPQRPGVYLMKGHADEVIYVGKAVNLRARVRSYFTRASSDTRAFVSLLDQLVSDIQTVVVDNEKEALLLENELIKKHHPRFNVQLRDDKQFLCLRLDTEHPYPRLETVRRMAKDGARYFGPYASAGSIRETLRVVNRVFQLRTCSDHVLANRKRPCLLFQIGRCPAPCVYPVAEREYKKSVDAVTLFLEGKAGPLKEQLHARMREASKELRFEEAARLRDQAIALERSLERQKVATEATSDHDFFGFYREADRMLVYVLYVRGGRIAGGQPFYFSGQQFPDDEVLESFVSLYYLDDNIVPDEVLLPFAPASLDGLAEVLSEKKGKKVPVRIPQRGEKVALIDLATQNAKQAFTERRRSREEQGEVLQRLQTALRLRRVPRRIECFDVSHFQGQALVASLVAATDGEPDKSRYRHFHLRTVHGNDDFASMHEIVGRRLKRAKADGDLPDLIVIDGGKGQLQAAQAAFKDQGVDDVDLVALAKSRDLDVADRDAEEQHSAERVFLAGRKDPVILPENSPELFVLTRLRDEAHRFAITFQRKVARKRTVRSALDEIPGIGAARRAALLKHFGSVKGLKAATVEELSEVDGIGPAVAERIFNALATDAAPAEDSVRDASLEDAAGS
jgi:excinuclease ABC subunit C